MQPLYNWSGLWRPISLQYFSNRLILICMGVAFLAAGAAYYHTQENYLPNALIWGSKIALVVFISWAIARELHPDAPWSAFVAVGLTCIGLWFWPDPNVLLLFFSLLMLRVVSRSSGIGVRVADVILLLAFTAWLLYHGFLFAGALAAVAFWLNSRLPKAQHWHLYLGLLLIVATMAQLGFNMQRPAPGQLSIYINMLVIGLATGFALFSRKLKKVESLADADNSPLYLERIRSAQSAILIVATVFTLWYGNAYFNSLGPIWASFGGIFIYAAFDRRGATKDDYRKE